MTRKGSINNILDTVSPPHIRVEWDYEHVTTPRPSCEPSLTLRNQLRALMPGEYVTIGGRMVKRLEAVSLSGKYSIDKRGRLTLAAGEGSAAA